MLTVTIVVAHYYLIFYIHGYIMNTYIVNICQCIEFVVLDKGTSRVGFFSLKVLAH